MAQGPATDKNEASLRLTMFVRKTWLLRLSVLLNLAVVLYVGSYYASRNGVDFVEEAASARGPASPEASQLTGDADADTGAAVTTAEARPTEVAPSAATTTTVASASLHDAIPCLDKAAEARTAQRSDYWVLYNYVAAKRVFHCWESVTYTTHADYTFLDNLKPLLERWQGPVSLAVHAPGSDFGPTLEAIRWARACLSPLVAELVTFHVFFGSRHVPKEVPRPEAAAGGAPVDCATPAPWVNVSSSSLYKSRSRILYPVNVGRNVAREAANTFYVLASDIELYPSPGVIPDFLEMVRRRDPPLLHPNPKVFPLSIFELEKGAALPQNKTELVSTIPVLRIII